MQHGLWERSKIQRQWIQLIQILKDNDSWVRSNAAWALGEIGDPNAIAPLSQAAGDNSSIASILGKTVGNVAADALKNWVFP
jgi:HEAT repeat protein